MSNDQNQRSGNADSASERALQQLFAHAQPREMPPEADTAEIRDAIYAEWDARTGRRVRWRRFVALAAAASVVVAVVLLNVGREPTLPVPSVAFIERLDGTVQAALEDGSDPLLQVGAAVQQGTTLNTGTGQLALRLASGGSLRVAPQTSVTLIGNARVELVDGTLYFDSEGARTEELTVMTTLGSVSDVGTQFFVLLESSSLEVGVRDGGVTITRGTDRIPAVAGEKLTVTAGAADVQREPIAAFGDEWQWTEALAPPFDIDGRRLIEFLEWVAIQTGRTLAFSDARAESVASETVLNGSIDLEPMPKLTAVIALTDLSYAIEGGQIVIATK